MALDINKIASVLDCKFTLKEFQTNELEEITKSVEGIFQKLEFIK